MYRTRSFTYLVASVFVALVVGCQSAAQSVSDQPDTPFKLATFEAGGDTTVGLVLGERVLAIGGASDHLVSQAQVSAMTLPNEMRAVIEQYDTVSKRLYSNRQLLQHQLRRRARFRARPSECVDQSPDQISMERARRRGELQGACRGYERHQPQQRRECAASERPARRLRSFENRRYRSRTRRARDVREVARSCIIDPGEPYYIPPGRERIDWEGEMAIIIGKPAYLVTQADAHDHVFGYSIMYDVSDRGGRTREVNMFPGPNWFDGKSTNRGAPFGPFITPTEFIADPANMRLVTKVNGVVKQDQTTADLIWNEENLIAYTTSILMLYPGDVIATGTPSGTGRERQEYLKPGDVVEIELEGVGTLTTPIESYKGSS